MSNEIKSKSIMINADKHESFKEFCGKKRLKIGLLTEDLISLYMDNPKICQTLIDESKEKN